MRERAAAPIAPDVPERLTPWTAAEAAYEMRLDEVELRELALAGVDAAGSSVRASRLTSVDLSGACLDRTSAIDVRLERCNLANAGAAGASLVRAEISGCRMTGVTLTETLLRDVTFADCRIDLASFAGCRLQQVTFRDCDLRHTDFLEARLVSVCFEGCDLGDADLRGARLMRCELQATALAGARGIERLAGTAMPWPDIVQQAGVWAAALGIEVLDDEP